VKFIKLFFAFSFCSFADVLSITILISDISFFKVVSLLSNEFTASNCSSIFISFSLINSLHSFSLMLIAFIFSFISTSSYSLSFLSVIFSFSCSSNFASFCTEFLLVSFNSFSLALSFISMLFRISFDVSVEDKCCCHSSNIASSSFRIVSLATSSCDKNSSSAIFFESSKSPILLSFSLLIFIFSSVILHTFSLSSSIVKFIKLFFAFSFCSFADVLSITILISDISFFKVVSLLSNEFTASNCSSIFISFSLINSLHSFSLMLITFISSFISISLHSLSLLSIIISSFLSSSSSS